MKIAVCEAPPVLEPATDDWHAFAGRVAASGADVALLNEMPFGGWIATAPQPDDATLDASHRIHEEGLRSFSDLGVPTVLVSRPIRVENRSVNEGLVWTEDGSVQSVHTKQFFPDEAGFYEARWYARGERRFDLAPVAGCLTGFLICTDVMFLEWARYYGRRGATLIVVPRATPRASIERWRTVIRSAAIVSGCYVATSNRNGRAEPDVEFGGRGWVFAPSGELLAETSAHQPVVVAEIDPETARQAQREYPCYVEDLPA